jgi:hypothetical protein
MKRKAPISQVSFGDWQTPAALAEQVVELLRSRSNYRYILEPTCGTGSFLIAAQKGWPEARMVGLDINESYLALAKAMLPDTVQLLYSDFFKTPWEQLLSNSEGPLLVLGNPPWVTSSELGALDVGNIPLKDNFKLLRGLDARTGKSNFDISEWMILRLLAALQSKVFTLALLCKLSVARRIFEFCAKERLPVTGELRLFDAKAHFAASVDAVLLLIESQQEGAFQWPLFSSLIDTQAKTSIAMVDGQLCSDMKAFLRTRTLEGVCIPEWRSGLKHDCSHVMEFMGSTGELYTLSGDKLLIEEDFVYPLLKGSDIANGRVDTARAILVPQRSLGEDTSRIAAIAPSTWDYLCKNRSALDNRKSSIYQKQPSFAVFGVGDYTFAPWKVAICGLYKRLEFMLIGPKNDKPVVLDDTCYFLPFSTETAARQALELLRSPPAQDFFNARIFWDAKRPITKTILQTLDLGKVQELIHPVALQGHGPAQLSFAFR